MTKHFAAAVLAALVVASTSFAARAQSVPMTVVDGNTPLPVTGNFLQFNGSSLPAIWGSQVAFNSPVGNSAAGQTDVDIWTIGVAGRGIRRVVGQATQIPGMAPDTFNENFGGAVEIVQGNVVFLGTSQSTGNFVGYYTVPAKGGPVRKLIDINDLVNIFGTAAPSFTQNFHVNAGPAGGEAVYEVNTDIPNGVPGPVAAILRTSLGFDVTTQYGPPDPFCCIPHTPDVSGGVIAMIGGSGHGADSVQTVGLSGTGYNLLAGQPGGPPPCSPGGDPSPYPDSCFLGVGYFTPQIDAGTVVLFASATGSNPAVAGIFSVPAGGGAFTDLVDTSTPVPGGSGNFQSPGFGSFAARQGIVVFQGTDAATGIAGIYAVPETGGAISKVVAVGDVLDNGFQLQDFRIGPEPLSGGVVVFLGTFANIQNGIFAVGLGG